MKVVGKAGPLTLHYAVILVLSIFCLDSPLLAQVIRDSVVIETITGYPEGLIYDSFENRVYMYGNGVGYYSPSWLKIQSRDPLIPTPKMVSNGAVRFAAPIGKSSWVIGGKFWEINDRPVRKFMILNSDGKLTDLPFKITGPFRNNVELVDSVFYAISLDTLYSYDFKNKTFKKQRTKLRILGKVGDKVILGRKTRVTYQGNISLTWRKCYLFDGTSFDSTTLKIEVAETVYKDGLPTKGIESIVAYKGGYIISGVLPNYNYVVFYDTLTQKAIPLDSRLNLPKVYNIHRNGSTLFLTGDFTFSDGKSNYTSVAKYNLNTKGFYPYSPHISGQKKSSVTCSALLDSNLYIIGGFGAVNRKEGDFVGIDTSTGQTNVNYLYKANDNDSVEFVSQNKHFLLFGGKNYDYSVRGAFISFEKDAYFPSGYRNLVLEPKTAVINDLSYDEDYLYLVGDFTSVNGQARKGVAVINKVDFSVTSHDIGFGRKVGNPNIVRCQRDGDYLYVSGMFDSVGNTALKAALLRYNVKKQKLDKSWLPNITVSSNRQLTSSFKSLNIVANTVFTTIHAEPNRKFISLTIDVNDASRVTRSLLSDNTVFDAKLAANGQVLVGGDFQKLYKTSQYSFGSLVSKGKTFKAAGTYSNWNHRLGSVRRIKELSKYYLVYARQKNGTLNDGAFLISKEDTLLTRLPLKQSAMFDYYDGELVLYWNDHSATGGMMRYAVQVVPKISFNFARVTICEGDLVKPIPFKVEDVNGDSLNITIKSLNDSIIPSNSVHLRRTSTSNYSFDFSYLKVGSTGIEVVATDGLDTTLQVFSISIIGIPKARLALDTVGSIPFCHGDSSKVSITGNVTPIWGKNGDLRSLWVDSNFHDVLKVKLESCISKDSIILLGRSYPRIDLSFADSVLLCRNDSLQLMAISNGTVIWNDSMRNGAYYKASSSGYLKLLSRDSFGCEVRDSMYTMVLRLPEVTVSNDTTVCMSKKIQLIARSKDSVTWHGGMNNYDSVLILSPRVFIAMSRNDQGCFAEDSMQVSVFPSKNIVFTFDSSYCAGDKVRLRASGDGTISWKGFPVTTKDLIVNSDTNLVAVLIDKSGCRTIDTATLRVETPQLKLMEDTTICKGDLIRVRYTRNTDSLIWNRKSLYKSPIMPVYKDFQIVGVAVTKNGCKDSDSLKVKTLVPIVPNVYYSDDRSSIYTSGEFKSYQWFLGAKPIQNGRDSFLNIKDTGLYRLRVIDSNGCDTFVNYHLKSLIAKQVEGELVKIYPNPAKDWVRIENLVSKPMQIEITNSAGQLVYTSKLKGQGQIDISAFSVGTYYLLCRNTTMVDRYQLVIIK